MLLITVCWGRKIEMRESPLPHTPYRRSNNTDLERIKQPGKF